MAFSVAATKSSLVGPPPVPTNIYTLQVAAFKPKVSKNGDSLNYNLEASILEPAAFAGRKVFASLNTKFFVAIRDFTHSTGNECEKTTVKNEETGEMEEAEMLPGFFENQDTNPQDPTKWGQYRGPLTNATFKAEVVLTEYQGKPKNEFRAFFCTVPDCAVKTPDIKHSTSLIKD